jgi:hypothetical protein
MSNFAFGGQHTHAQAYKIKGPYFQLEMGPAGHEADTGKRFFLIKFKSYETPNSPPHKVEYIVTEEFLPQAITALPSFSRGETPFEEEFLSTEPAAPQPRSRLRSPRTSRWEVPISNETFPAGSPRRSRSPPRTAPIRQTRQ